MCVELETVSKTQVDVGLCRDNNANQKICTRRKLCTCDNKCSRDFVRTLSPTLQPIPSNSGNQLNFPESKLQPTLGRLAQHRPDSKQARPNTCSFPDRPAPENPDRRRQDYSRTPMTLCPPTQHPTLSPTLKPILPNPGNTQPTSNKLGTCVLVLSAGGARADQPYTTTGIEPTSSTDSQG